MKYLLITGGTKGIGRACVERFGAAGWAVATAARSAADLLELERQWQALYPSSPLLTVAADLSTVEGVATVVNAVQEAWPRVDVLINNAGRFEMGGVVTGADVLPELLDLNVLCAYRLCRALLPGMLERGAGHLITIGSTATEDIPADRGQYTISKFALLGLHRVLESELRDSGIKTTLVLPGATHTASWAGEPIAPGEWLAPETVAGYIHAAAAAPPDTVIPELIIRPHRPAKNDKA